MEKSWAFLLVSLGLTQAAGGPAQRRPQEGHPPQAGSGSGCHSVTWTTCIALIPLQARPAPQMLILGVYPKKAKVKDASPPVPGSGTRPVSFLPYPSPIQATLDGRSLKKFVAIFRPPYTSNTHRPFLHQPHPMLSVIYIHQQVSISSIFILPGLPLALCLPGQEWWGWLVSASQPHSAPCWTAGRITL